MEPITSHLRVSLATLVISMHKLKQSEPVTSRISLGKDKYSYTKKGVVLKKDLKPKFQSQLMFADDISYYRD